MIWDQQTPPSPAFGYWGTEELFAGTKVIEAGLPFACSTGLGQSGFSNGGRTFLSKLAATGTQI